MNSWVVWQSWRGLRLGGPDAEADMGPLISSRQQKSVLSYISEGPAAINEFLKTKTVSIKLEH